MNIIILTQTYLHDYISTYNYDMPHSIDGANTHSIDGRSIYKSITLRYIGVRTKVTQQCGNCRINTATRRQPIITAQLPRLHPTATDTQTIQQQPEHSPSDPSYLITTQSRTDSTGESAVPGWSRGWRSDAGEATIWEPRLWQNRGSVRAGKSSEEHQFDLFRNPPEIEFENLHFRILIA